MTLKRIPCIFAPFDNQNKPIVDIEDATVPLNYFNIVKLKKGDAFEYQVPGYETCIAPATGSADINIEGFKADDIGGRVGDVWGGEPEGVYVPSGARSVIVCTSDEAEVFVAGARYDDVLDPFAVRSDEIDLVQYGSDDTKTHRKIKHILGQSSMTKSGACWSVNCSLSAQVDGQVFQVISTTLTACPSRRDMTRPTTSGSSRTTALVCKCCSDKMANLVMPIISLMARRFVLIAVTTHAAVLPGYEMYYFTILGGLSQRSLIQYFQPSHADQIETIPGIKDMIAKFK